MIGVFVPWTDRSNSPGWIIDGDGCHIWIGSRDTDGYGKAKIRGVSRAVHRIRYEREIGPIPEGAVLDHYVCDNGPGGCCNPRHCRPSTHRLNILRGVGPTAINALKTHCFRGHLLAGDNLLRAKHPHWRSCKECRDIYQRGRRAERAKRTRGTGDAAHV